jgi:hypothetical protein
MTLDSKAKGRRKPSCQDNPEKHALKEAYMNNLDMYTREKANKIHLDEMHQEAQNRRKLRELKPGRDLIYITVNRRRIIALAVSLLIAAIASFLIVSNMGLLHTL